MLSRIIFICVLSSSLNLFGSDLTVKGTALLFKPADEISFSVGVVTQEKTAESALSKNNTKMNAVLQTFKKAGLDSSEYSTGRFSIHPVYSQRPKDPSPNWKAQIIGYEVSNSLNIKTGKIKQAGNLLDIATRSGADNIGSISFAISNPRLYRKEAIERATANAIEDAKFLATASGVTLGNPISVTLDDAQKPAPKAMMAYRALESVPIEPGDVEVKASVTITYELIF